MRKLIVVLLTLFYIGFAHGEQYSEESKIVVCFEGHDVFNALKAKYKEEPLIVAQHGNGYMAFFYNKKTNTFSIFEFNERVACLISAGKNVKILKPELLKDTL